MRISLDKVDPKLKARIEAAMESEKKPRQKTYTILTDPIGKPRMTQRDKWAKRTSVLKYFAFKDEIKAAIPNPPPPAAIRITAFLAMPSSWSKKKREASNLQPHTQKPDVDNIAKAVLDSLYSEDSKVYSLTVTKFWATNPKIEVSF